MVIECSSCHARFKLADDKIKENGTKVRCTKCREVFAVFPESPPPSEPPVVAVVPVSPIVPDVTPQKKVLGAASFSVPDTSPSTTEIPLHPVVDVPAKEDNRNQNAAPNPLSAGAADEAGATDLDAISFDNVESPVFSVTREKKSKFELTDDTAFSFSDLSLKNEMEQPDKITAATDEKSLSTERDNDFEAAPLPVPTLPSPENLNQFNPVATDSEFTFSGADNLADFSWGEPDPTPVATSLPKQTKETGAAPQDTAFDFSSFSFDDADSSSGSVENRSDETVAKSKAKIELSLEAGTGPAPLETSLPLIEVPSPPVARERQENTPRPTRPLRPRVRQQKKSFSRLAVKVIFLILLALAAMYGVMNRDQIQKMYKNIVSSFIENQSRIDTDGRIVPVKLSGSFMLNSQEGDLFVIRGEVVNEFKGLRSSVLVRGTIYGDNGAVLQSQSAYCGNPLSDSSLKNLGFKEIRHIMSNELGENLANLDIAAGKGIPFTIVFNKVPKNINEFTVEVLESKPGSK